MGNYGTTTDDEFITLLFQNLLGREPAPAGTLLDTTLAEITDDMVAVF